LLRVLLGGQLTTTTEVENYPGFVEGIDGNQLIDNMTKQAERFGAEMQYGTVTKVEPGDPIRIYLEGATPLETKALIVATGARPRKLGISSEAKWWSKGVTSCATCDGYFYRGKEVCVIGGGDSAMEEATFLTRYCPRVHIIHRRGTFRASKVMAERVLKNPKIVVEWNSVVEEILGDENRAGALKVTGVGLRNLITSELKILPVEGVFLAIGHIPNTDFLKGVVDLDQEGYVITKPNSTKTNVEGIFVSGDAQDRVFRQAITAAGTGCMAAIEAERWLEERGQ
jgi:thioredoxin reductase (NADPH)